MIDPEHVQLGDVVTSRWSNSGTRWRVIQMTEVFHPYPGSKPTRELTLRSLSSNRERTEKTWNLAHVS